MASDKSKSALGSVVTAPSSPAQPVRDVEPQVADSLPGVVRCVITHGTLRRDKIEYGMGQFLSLPAEAAEELVALGVAEIARVPVAG